MTADDVIFSTMRVLDTGTGSAYRQSFVNAETDESLFKTIDAVDSHTIHITLHQPHPRLEELFFVHVNAIMPQEAIADINTFPVGYRTLPLQGAHPGCGDDPGEEHRLLEG